MTQHCAHTPQQAARLLAAFREYKRREAVGLAAYYANKLAALEVGCSPFISGVKVPTMPTSWRLWRWVARL
eukprot:1156062-Pelagomonas_calceolata.AAC.2